MALISVDDLKNMFDSERIAELATDPSDSGGESDTRIETIIAQADSYIKGQLAKQYNSTAVEADASLQRLCGSIAMYYLEMRRGSCTAEIKEQYINALQHLRDIQDGTAILEAQSQLLPSITPTDAVNAFEESGLFEGMPDIE